MHLKKILILIILLTLCLGIVACKNPNDEPDNTEKVNAVHTPISDSYNGYVLEKTERFVDFTSEVYDERELLLPTSSALFSISEIELDFLPLSLLYNAEKAGGHFEGIARGCMDCVVNVTDSEFELSYSKYDGETELIRGTYDIQNGSLYCELYEDDQLGKTMEYLCCDGGYIAQYTKVDEDETKVFRILIDDSLMGIACVTDTTAKRISELNREDFLKSDVLSVILKDGIITATVDGKTSEY